MNERVKDLKIERNPNNSRISATFKIGEQTFFADVCTCVDYDECMIFPAYENGYPVNWLEVYGNRDVNVTEEDLLRCIDEFANGELKQTHEDKIERLVYGK